MSSSAIDDTTSATTAATDRRGQRVRRCSRFMRRRLPPRGRRSCTSRAPPASPWPDRAWRRCRPPSNTSSVSDSPISSSRSAETSSDGQPAAPAPRMTSQIGGLRTDVDATGRVRGDAARSGSASHLPPDDELLLVAARQGERGHLGPGVRTSNSSMISLVRRAAPRRGRSRSPVANGRLRLVAEHDVLPQRRREHEAVALAVLRDVPEATRHGARLGAEAGGVAPVDLDAAGGERLGCRAMAPDQLGLAVALHAGDADDLAPMHAERDVRRPEDGHPRARRR